MAEVHPDQRRLLPEAEEIAAEPRIRAVDVAKTYGDASTAVHALRGVSLDVRAGELVGLIGPSGCGKSTLLNLIGCIDRPTSGRITIDGCATSGLDDDALTRLRRDRVGTIFQFFNLLPAMSIGENVALPLILQRRPSVEIDAAVRAALEAVGIADKADALPPQCSGGQLQRAAVARATIHRPAVVLADEPTGNLDTQSGMGVLRLLREAADRGQAIVMATHSDEAARTCDRLVHLRDGQIA